MDDKTTTGILALDEIVGGGLPRPAAIGLIGEMGTEKSLLAKQIAWTLLKQGFHVLYYTVNESADDVRCSMSCYDWDITEYERDDKFNFVDLFSHGINILGTNPDTPYAEYINQVFDFSNLLKEGQDFCLRKMAGKDLLVIIDSLDPMFLLLDEQETLNYLKRMKVITQASRCIGIAILTIGSHQPELEESYKQISDMVIELRKIGSQESPSWYIRVEKASGNARRERYPIEIIEKHGIVVYLEPVLEEVECTG